MNKRNKLKIKLNVAFWRTGVSASKNPASSQCNDLNEWNKQYRNFDSDKPSVFEKLAFDFRVNIFGLKFGDVTLFLLV